MTYTVRAYDHDDLEGWTFGASDYENALDMADALVDHGEFIERNNEGGLRIVGRSDPYDVAYVYCDEEVVYTVLQEQPALLYEPKILSL